MFAFGLPRAVGLGSRFRDNFTEKAMMNSRRSVAAWAATALLVFSAPGAQAQGSGPYYAVPSWSQTLPDATRFILLANFGNKAFLDRNTGLVWASGPLEWEGSLAEADASACQTASFGLQWGWRLPAFHELLTLFKPLQDSPETGSLYGTQLQPAFIRYPPGVPGETHILAAKHGSSYKFMEHQVDRDWNIYNATSNGAQVLSRSYVWCVRGPGGGTP
jgi:hypothetical protein